MITLRTACGLFCALSIFVFAARAGADVAPSLRLTVVDRVTAAPLGGADVQFQCPKAKNKSYKTSADGTVDIELPDHDPNVMYWVTVEAKGYVPTLIRSRASQSADSDRLPDEYRLELEKGTPLKGRVVDETGKPFEGAGVQLHVQSAPDAARPFERVQIAYDTEIKTDADGRWSYEAAPAMIQSANVGAYHVAHGANEHGFYNMETVKQVESLRDGSFSLKIARGSIIRGTVLGTDDKPIPGAKVGLGRDRVASNVLPEARTDDAGKFEIGCKPGAAVTLTVQAKGFAPELQQFTMPSTGDSDVEFQLQPAKTLAGHVLDPDGKPVANAWVWMESWRGGRTINQTLRTDAAGRFEWKGAPADTVVGDVHAEGFARFRSFNFVASAANEVKLIRPAVVRGTVVDDATGERISGFRVLKGVSFDGKPEGVHWLRSSDDEGVKITPGAFEFTLTFTYPGHAVRIETDEHLPADSAIFAIADGNQNLTFRLRRGASVVGRLVDSQQKPLANAVVCLVAGQTALQVVNGAVPDYASRDVPTTRTGPDGVFRFPAQVGSYAIVSATDAGLARVDIGAAGPTTQPSSPIADLVARPWATVEGVAMIGARPAAGETIAANVLAEGPQSEDAAPRIYLSNTAEVKTDGTFVLQRVPPAKLHVARQIATGANMTSTTHAVTLSLAPGERAKVQIGGQGRPVVGSVNIPDELRKRGNWSFAMANLSSKNEIAPMPVPDEVMALDAAAQTEWRKTWLQTDEGKAYIAAANSANERRRYFPIKVEADGSWRVDDVPAGSYSIHLSAFDMPPGDTCGFGEQIGDAAGEVTVPDMPSGRSDEPLAAETLTLKVRKLLNVGDIAPALAGKTMDDKPFALADLKGKYVLVDFWATWCGPCVAEMPQLKSLHERYSKDERFVLLGANFDETIGTCRTFVQKQSIGWQQVHLGAMGKSPAVADWGINGIPSVFLIGPDGKVLARNLRGAATEAAIKQALGE